MSLPGIFGPMTCISVFLLCFYSRSLSTGFHKYDYIQGLSEIPPDLPLRKGGDLYPPLCVKGGEGGFFPKMTFQATWYYTSPYL